MSRARRAGGVAAISASLLGIAYLLYLAYLDVFVHTREEHARFMLAVLDGPMFFVHLVAIGLIDFGVAVTVIDIYQRSESWRNALPRMLVYGAFNAGGTIFYWLREFRRPG